MGLAWLSAILVGAGCLAFGYCIGSRRPACVFLRVNKLVGKDTAFVTTQVGVVGSKKVKKSKEALEIEKLADILDDFKMVLVVRNDLKMGKGKIAAQCRCACTLTYGFSCKLFGLDDIKLVSLSSINRLKGWVTFLEVEGAANLENILAHTNHATLGLYKKLLHRAPKALNRWEMCAQPKVVVKIESEEDMLALQERAKSLNLPTHITIDAGRTQIAPRWANAHPPYNVHPPIFKNSDGYPWTC